MLGQLLAQLQQLLLLTLADGVVLAGALASLEGVAITENWLILLFFWLLLGGGARWSLVSQVKVDVGCFAEGKLVENWRKLDWSWSFSERVRTRCAEAFTDISIASVCRLGYPLLERRTLGRGRRRGKKGTHPWPPVLGGAPTSPSDMTRAVAVKERVKSAGRAILVTAVRIILAVGV